MYVDNGWAIRVAEWVSRERKRSRGPQKIRWSDKIGKFAGTSWNHLAKGLRLVVVASKHGSSCSGHKNRLMMMTSDWVRMVKKKSAKIILVLKMTA